jgi:hypothetical protein
MAQGDLPTPRGSPRRRRREKRQLERLAEASERHDAPGPATAHVRVVEAEARTVIGRQADAPELDHEGEDPDSAIDGPLQGRGRGFRVRAVPIDQPLGE